MDRKPSGANMVAKESSVTWERAGTAFSASNHYLKGSDGNFSFEDVDQGWLGNCWFLAAAIALAEKPGRLEKVFVNSENSLSNNGIYAVNFKSLGYTNPVIIDDYLPLRVYDWAPSTFYTLFSHVGDDSSIWGTLIEKAFAKYMGNYYRIVAGDTRNSLQYLWGAPGQSFQIIAPYWNPNATLSSADEIWSHVSNNHEFNMITISSTDD